MNAFNNSFAPELLKDQVIIVTGGGTGLGKAMARGFLSLGAKVVLAGRKADVLENAIAELAVSREDIIGIPTDVRDPGRVDELFEKSIKRFGKVDALVNNAAVNLVSPTERLNHVAFRLVVDTVLMGTIHCVLTAGDYWIKNHLRGNVLNIITGYAKDGSGFVVPSAVAKAGVRVLTKSLATEWAKYGIRFNAIAPGPFPTDGAFSRILPDERMREMAIKKVPMQRFGEMHELANLASFLLSDLSGYISGEVITIDGALHLNLSAEMNYLADYFLKGEWKCF
jgi:NAD(P)-dependent dehydrogenase (short-subunit alcohol dehydrogenase family)